MANMVKCKSCSKKIAQYARACPLCGQKNPTINTGVGVLIILGIAVGVTYWLVG